MFNKKLRIERLESRSLLAADWTNPANPLDVNGSGEVTPLDALILVDDIGHNGFRELPTVLPVTTTPAYLDVNDDGLVSPMDVLEIVDTLSRYRDPMNLTFSSASEGESASLFKGRTLPNTTVVIEQLAAVLPKRWTFTSDANGEFAPFDVGTEGLVARATAVDPLGRTIKQNLEFVPGQAAPSLSSLSETGGPKIGDQAPPVVLLNQNGQQVSLHDKLQSGPVVLYFYPKDNTPKCTVQAQDLRDRSAELQELGATVLGVSIDPVESHLEFADKYDLNFDILADDSKVVTAAYGVLSSFNGQPIAARTTFIISSDGTVREIFRDVDVTIHGQRVVDALKQITA